VLRRSVEPARDIRAFWPTAWEICNQPNGDNERPNTNRNPRTQQNVMRVRRSGEHLRP